MSVVESDLKMYRSVVWGEGSTNGGPMGASQVVHLVAGNIWPDVSQAERAAGSVRYRKVFYKNTNAGGSALTTTKFFLERPTASEDRVVLFPGTQLDTQGSLDESRLYGTGALDEVSGAAATVLTVLCEDASDAVFQIGDTVRVSDQATFGGAGNEEWRELTDVQSAGGDLVELTLDSALAYEYAVGSVVSSVYLGADLETVVSGWAETSTSGTFDETTYPLEVTFAGGVQETWTLAFTSATAFTCVGARLGSVGSGTTSADFAPANPAGGEYFTLNALGWGGTWATSDEVTFTTAPAAQPLWLKRTVPAGAASASGVLSTVVLVGESA